MYPVHLARLVQLLTDLEAGGHALLDVLLVSFSEEFDNGESGATPEIDWKNGQKQRITLTSNSVSLSFVDPPGPGNFILKVVQDNQGGRSINGFPSNSLAPSGSLTFSAAPLATDIVALYFDGVRYYWSVVSDFQPI